MVHCAHRFFVCTLRLTLANPGRVARLSRGLVDDGSDDDGSDDETVVRWVDVVLRSLAGSGAPRRRGIPGRREARAGTETREEHDGTG